MSKPVTQPALPYVAYADSEDVPNIVVDGGPNQGTVLTLSHWPGIPAPAGLARDLSAEMAFAYLDDPPAHAPAAAITNTHFDQDGLVAAFALHAPGQALEHRELLIDVAAAGDFATYRDRNAARAAMAIGAYGALERSPLRHELKGLPEARRDGVLYPRLLPLLVPIATDPDMVRDLWAEEDARLTDSERAIESGLVSIEEVADLDLAIIRLPAGLRFRDLHPMAVNNASGCFRQLFIGKDRYRYLDRYETWVKYQSRRPLQRVDLRPLAERLSAAEPGATSWRADAPSFLYPSLSATGASGLSPAAIVDHLTRHLRDVPPAWDPYAARTDLAS